MAEGSLIRKFEQMVLDAQEGRLTLEVSDPQVFETCIRACEDFKKAMQGELDMIGNKTNVRGFGTCLPAVQLAAGFSRKAQGGPNSYYDQIAMFITCADHLIATFQANRATYEETERANAQRFHGIAAGLDGAASGNSSSPVAAEPEYSGPYPRLLRW
ncbi:MAG: hypothetical protein ACRCSF_06640 [Mycobacteriaceae bacterium]